MGLKLNTEMDKQVGRYLEQCPPTANDVFAYSVGRESMRDLPYMTITFWLDGDKFAACGAPQETEQESS